MSDALNATSRIADSPIEIVPDPEERLSQGGRKFMEFKNDSSFHYSPLTGIDKLDHEKRQTFNKVIIQY